MSAVLSSRSGLHWLPEEDERLRNMIKSGFSRDWMAKCLGRKQKEVSDRVYRLSLLPKVDGIRAHNWRANIPSWVPDRLHEEYEAVAFEDGDEAAARWARKELGIDYKPKPRLRPTQKSKPVRNIFGSTERDIMRRICWLHGVAPSEVVGAAKPNKIAFARQHFIWLMRRHTSLSSTQIGRIVGRDHTTVLHAVKRIDDEIKRRRELWGSVR